MQTPRAGTEGVKSHLGKSHAIAFGTWTSLDDLDDRKCLALYVSLTQTLAGKSDRIKQRTVALEKEIVLTDPENLPRLNALIQEIQSDQARVPLRNLCSPVANSTMTRMPTTARSVRTIVAVSPRCQPSATTAPNQNVCVASASLNNLWTHSESRMK